jgi:hypothetical protein
MEKAEITKAYFLSYLITIVNYHNQEHRNCMSNRIAIIGQKKRIALIAHDHQKPALLEWVKFNKGTLLKHKLYATGTTGKMLETELGSKITVFESGPLGGD